MIYFVIYAIGFVLVFASGIYAINDDVRLKVEYRESPYEMLLMIFLVSAVWPFSLVFLGTKKLTDKLFLKD